MDQHRSEEPAEHDSSSHEKAELVHTKFAKYRFVILILGSVIIALMLTIISMQLYSSSGTAQLDLSRPGYKSVRDQITKEEKFDGFPGSGPIDEASLRDFKELYDKRAQEAAADAFETDTLSDQALGIDAPVE